MKRPLTRTLSLFLSLVLILGTVTLCWFSLPDTVDFPTSFGSANAAYFESGDGSASDPYIISQPVHLYNLAWLQYLGYFNLNPSLNNGRAQSYFKLKNNIVMTNVAIPPIGTEEYPFIGKFDGNHKTIGSLTVSNSFADLTRHPTAAVFDAETSAGKLQTAGSDTSDASKMTEVAIVGLFGVTGDYGSAIGSGENTDYSGKTIYQYTDPDAEEKTLVSPPTDLTAITVNDLYYASMFVGNFYTDRLHVRSASAKTLIGLVAGYVGGGFENVGVYRADITMTKGVSALKEDDSSGIVSKYTLVGDYDTSAVGWSEEPKGTGSGESGWGGTIDMELFARRLKNLLAATQKDSSGNRVVTGYATASATSYTQKFAYYRSTNFNFYGALNASDNAALTGANYSLDTTKSMSIALLGGVNNDYTILPLNVNRADMGLEGTLASTSNSEKLKSTTVDQNAKVYKYENAWSSAGRFTPTTTSLSNVFQWKILCGYLDAEQNNKAETVQGNTGYIVGANSYSQNGGIVLDVRPRTSSSGIYKAFGYTSASEWTTYNTGELRLLTYNAANTGFSIIGDSKNGLKGGVTTSLAGTNFTVINSSTLQKYDSIRDDFDAVLGEDGSIYGLLFSSYGIGVLPSGNTNPYSTLILKDVNLYGEEKTNYPLITGAINFTVKEDGVIVAIVGTYNKASSSDNMQGHFNLYQVDRDATDGTEGREFTSGAVTVGVREIIEIYEDEDGNITNVYYNETDGTTTAAPTGATKIYDKLWYTRNDHSASNTGTTPLSDYYAYYIEIPVSAGDYLLSTNGGGSNGYLMYLDIGANGDTGSDSSTAMPYLMQRVDFINDSSVDAEGRVTVPSETDSTGGASYRYPQYADVILKLSGVGQTGDAVIVVKRATGTSTNSNGEINTTLQYRVTSGSVVVTPLPSELAENDSTLSKEDDESG